MTTLSPNANSYSLSPSGIERYLTCPRQYFYAQQLQLNPSGQNIAQLFGLSVHALMEATLLTENPSIETLRGFQKNLFEIETPSTQATETLGRVQMTLAQCTRIRQLQLQNHLQLAFESLEASAFFTQFLPQYTIHAVEKAVSIKAPLGLNALSLGGRIDILLQHAQNGRYLILDYKTSRSQFKKSPDKNLADFEASIQAPIDWENPVYSDRFKKRHLQLPLYWLMLKQQQDFKTVDIGLQLIRPEVFGGCDTLIIRDEMLANTVEDLQKTLDRGLLNALKNQHPFEALGSQVTCRQCDYNTICPKGLENPQNEDTEE